MCARQIEKQGFKGRLCSNNRHEWTRNTWNLRSSTLSLFRSTPLLAFLRFLFFHPLLVSGLADPPCG